VVAPFTEEYTFRACMLPILLGYYSPVGAVVVSPLFFGIAHLHHMIERIRKGQDVQTAILISLFQGRWDSPFIYLYMQ
jgi:prenyl protein peptidase